MNAIESISTHELLALKRIEKAAVLQSQAHLASVWIERRILSLNTSPFLLNLIHAFESPTELFLVMPFMQGGDLRYHLKERGTMNEETMRFYAAELLLGLEAMHQKHIIYRDLKPENVLLDSRGHLRISDFGLAAILNSADGYKTVGQAGTRGYQAPEVLADTPYGTEVDVWSYGVTLFELLHGYRPWKDWARLPSDFMSEDAMCAFDPSVSSQFANGTGTAGGGSSHPGEFHISSRVSKQAQSLLRGLLKVSVSERLGCGTTGWAEVKNHPFFSGVDWALVERTELDPPIKPDTTHANCTADADLADQLLDKKPRPIPPDQQRHFQGWKWRCDLTPEPNTTNTNHTNNANNANNATTTANIDTNNINTTSTSSSSSSSASTATSAGDRSLPSVAEEKDDVLHSHNNNDNNTTNGNNGNMNNHHNRAGSADSMKRNSFVQSEQVQLQLK